MIEFIEVYKSYNKIPFIEGLSFKIMPDTINQIIAPQSHGKTTILKMVYGMIKPDSGFIRIFGTDITRLSYKKVVVLRRYIGIIFEDIRLINTLTVAENITFLEKLVDRGFSFFKDIVQILEINDILNKYPYELSLSEQALVGIARSVSYNYPLIIADEPFRFISDKKRRGILEFFKDINQKRGVTFLISSQNALDENFHTIIIG